jgi:catechol 2,3-dioxygenase-like lactoylglutathione lyase family enzyme
MKVEWMNHTGFVVSNLERSLEFYRDLLGLEVERDKKTRFYRKCSLPAHHRWNHLHPSCYGFWD